MVKQMLIKFISFFPMFSTNRWNLTWMDLNKTFCNSTYPLSPMKSFQKPAWDWLASRMLPCWNGTNHHHHQSKKKKKKNHSPNQARYFTKAFTSKGILYIIFTHAHTSVTLSSQHVAYTVRFWEALLGLAWTFNQLKQMWRKLLVHGGVCTKRRRQDGSLFVKWSYMDKSIGISAILSENDQFFPRK